MATSGSIDYTRTRNQIIEGALRLVGAKRRGQTLSGEDTAEADEALNLLVKSLSADEHLWKLQEISVFLQSGSQSYSLGSGHATTSYVQTTLSAAASDTDTTISVTSATGITDTYYIGVELDDGSLHWTTVNGAPSGTTVTLTDALTDDCASGNYVYCYQTQANRPLRIKNPRIKVSTSEVPLETLSRDEYFKLTNKSSPGRVNQVYYDPQLSNGVLYVWPVTNSVQDVLNITCIMPIEDFDASGNTPDLPQEWFEALKWQLASRLGPEKGLDLNRQMYLDNKAGQMLANVLSWDDGEEDIYFQCDN